MTLCRQIGLCRSKDINGWKKDIIKVSVMPRYLLSRHNNSKFKDFFQIYALWGVPPRNTSVRGKYCSFFFLLLEQLCDSIANLVSLLFKEGLRDTVPHFCHRSTKSVQNSTATAVPAKIHRQIPLSAKRNGDVGEKGYVDLTDEYQSH